MTLFPRYCMYRKAKSKAHRILDDAKAGLDVSVEDITWALRVTGDLE